MSRTKPHIIQPPCGGYYFKRHLLNADCSVSNQLGSDYTGTQTQTVNGKTCQRWDEDYPHPHTNDAGHLFPDGDMDAVANNCR